MIDHKLEELVLDMEISLSNRPLPYVEDDIQLNILTPCTMILGRDGKTINSAADGDSDEWTKRQRYVQQCEGNS